MRNTWYSFKNGYLAPYDHMRCCCWNIDMRSSKNIVLASVPRQATLPPQFNLFRVGTCLSGLWIVSGGRCGSKDGRRNPNGNAIIKYQSKEVPLRWRADDRPSRLPSSRRLRRSPKDLPVRVRNRFPLGNLRPLTKYFSPPHLDPRNRRATIQQGGEKSVVPIRLAVRSNFIVRAILIFAFQIILPLDLGGATHQLVINENVSVDSVKVGLHASQPLLTVYHLSVQVALWKEVPELWEGHDRMGYSVVLKKTKVCWNPLCSSKSYCCTPTRKHSPPSSTRSSALMPLPNYMKQGSA